VKKANEEFALKLKAETARKIQEALARAEAHNAQKKTAALRLSKADQVKKANEEAALKLKAETARKIQEALARAEAHKLSAAKKGAAMANTKVESFRQEEEASISFTKEMNEKRHAQAALRADSAKKQRSARGAQLAVPKVEAVKLLKESSAQKLKAGSEKKAAEALARAAATKTALAEKAAGMSASDKYAAVKAREDFSASAKKEKFAARQALASQKRLELQKEKQGKANLMGTPVRKRGLSISPTSAGSSSASPPRSLCFSPTGQFPCPPPAALTAAAKGDASSLEGLAALVPIAPPAPPSEADMQIATSALLGALDRGEKTGSPGGEGMKVVTLRRDSPVGVGNHVVTIVTSATEESRAEELAQEVASSVVEQLDMNGEDNSACGVNSDEDSVGLAANCTLLEDDSSKVRFRSVESSPSSEDAVPATTGSADMSSEPSATPVRTSWLPTSMSP